MNGNSIFADTNIIIYLLQGDSEISEILQGKDVYISFITELELLAFPGINVKQEKQIQKLLSEVKSININNEIKRLAVTFRKEYKLKLPDAIVAASSNFYNIPLISGDTVFKKVDEIDLIHYKV